MLRTIGNREVILNSTIDSGDKYVSQLVTWEDFAVGSYLAIVAILAILLNSLVIYTCFKNWRSLATSDLYILNLACSDIILPMCAFPLAISSSYRHYWIFGDIGCTLYGFLGFFFGLVSITTLTIMGAMRYISICHPDKESSSSSRTTKVIVYVYLYSFLWSVIPLTGWGSYTVEAYGTSCTIQWNGNRSFITLMSLICIVAPSIVIALAYGLILLKCQKSTQNLNKWSTRLSKNFSRKEGYLVKMTFAMCWGFLITWMPYAVVSMWTAYGDPTKLPTRMTVMAVLTAKSSTVINPIIYVLMSRKFQPLIRQSFQNLYKNSSSQSVSLQTSNSRSPRDTSQGSVNSCQQNSGSSSSSKTDLSSELTTIRANGYTYKSSKESQV